MRVIKVMIYDLIIIGGGPAGLTAGIYAARGGLKTALVSKDVGGTTNSILELENWPGFKGPGAKLMKQFYEHLKEYDVDVLMEEVESVKKKGNFVVKTRKKEVEARSLILATGTERKHLNVKGEKEFVGKGVSYCVTCDAFFFKKKIVGVVGGSDCAATSAIALADIAKKVYVIYRGEKLRCEDINAKRLEEKENVEIIYNAVPREILGNEKVNAMKLEVKGEEKNVELDGVFIEIGATPLTKFLEEMKIKMDNEKYIKVDEEMRTSVEGVFACGDITHHKLKQVVVASGQGAIAAKSAGDFIKNK